MTFYSPTEDADLVASSSNFNMPAVRSHMRYVCTSTVTTSTSTNSLLPTGASVSFLKLFWTSWIRIDMTMDFLMTSSVGNVVFGLRFKQAGSGLTSDADVINAGVKSTSETHYVAGSRMTIPSGASGMYLVQPFWRATGGTAEFQVGHALSYVLKEVEPL